MWPLLTKPSTHRKAQQQSFWEKDGKRKKDPDNTVKKRITPQTNNHQKKTHTNEQQLNAHLLMHQLKIHHPLHSPSYRSCWGLGWGRCGVYSGPEQRRKATDQTGWGCCWPLAVLGLAAAGTPSYSGWGWKLGLERTSAAAAVAAAGMLWLVDYCCSARWRGQRTIWMFNASGLQDVVCLSFSSI